MTVYDQIYGLIAANNVYLIYKVVHSGSYILYFTISIQLILTYNIGLAISLYRMSIDYICFSVYNI
ncbi:hypothetical protein MTHERMMSTA1_17430 [Methanosarcina thermophila MST-A1]|uniref:Chitin synthase n=1 Tax=Methanosarcina thermophila TaxID=2210 RepID=A0A3G9CV58_METTE|nr:chitin synthase [Methanosarcina thermophila]GLI14617.1 hypothetical protein MTHERMMSTA1_17430 [Methanosarcina thermophila MST-A1]